MSSIYAPWTDEQVAALNRWQETSHVHPFTCGSERMGYSDRGILIATNDGWTCPVCDYTQNWAHDFMLEPPPEHPMKAAMERYEKKTKRDKP